MSAQREMTLQEWVDKLPGIHSAHKEFDSLQATIAQQAERIAEMEAEAAENCRIIGMSGEVEARHLARIAELEKVAQAYEDQVAEHNKTLDELARLAELIDEQKGTIRALNMALGGDGSPSTENLIDANEIDAGDKGLIALCREQSALIEKCERALRLVQKYAPITLDCEAFHHPKSMQHDSESTCEPAARYYHALNEVGKIIAAIAAQKGGAA